VAWRAERIERSSCKSDLPLPIRFRLGGDEETKRVDKPWGHELWWAETDHYAGKILVINAGQALSLQYHREKDETSYLLSGKLRLTQGPNAETLSEEDRAGSGMAK
jgi:mannose-6-phosphate isomerase-like protein (cupin superfamily)